MFFESVTLHQLFSSVKLILSIENGLTTLIAK